jgi:hypothetical protein
MAGGRHEAVVDVLVLGRLPGVWIAPPATRELREMVRHRVAPVWLRATPGTEAAQKSGMLSRLLSALSSGLDRK